MVTDLRCEFTDESIGDDLGVVDAGLHLHNMHAVDLDAVRTLACLARDAAGRVRGGMRARQWGAAVEVQQLWVEPLLRRQGVGMRLMRLLEEEVRRRGALLIYLDTFSFQAPAFCSTSAADSRRRCGWTASRTGSPST